MPVEGRIKRLEARLAPKSRELGSPEEVAILGELEAYARGSSVPLKERDDLGDVYTVCISRGLTKCGYSDSEVRKVLPEYLAAYGRGEEYS